MVRAQKFQLLCRFEGEPKLSDFQLVSEELPALKEGEVLAVAEFLSVDPYMRLYNSRETPGSTIKGTQVARVLESKSPDWKVGDRAVSSFGWRTHTIFNKDNFADNSIFPAIKLPELGNLPSSLGLGVLGMPGNTAYFGFLDICHPKKGETVVVSGAAGAVGSVVGQIAKIKGCKVIGIAGSDDKVKWLTKDLAFDAAINYKTKNVAEALKEAAPNGVDCYFDNVGGDITAAVLEQMNHGGRVSVCGVISSYNEIPANKGLINPLTILGKELRIEGFWASRFSDRWMEGIDKNLEWIREGKIKYEETITKGFENMPSAFIGMLKGQNTGKAIVKV